MAYSIIKGKTLVPELAAVPAEFDVTKLFFNYQDIEALMEQDDASGISIGNVTINGKIHTVMYAITGTGQTENENVPEGNLLDPGDGIALFCPDIVIPNKKIDFNDI